MLLFAQTSHWNCREATRPIALLSQMPLNYSDCSDSVPPVRTFSSPSALRVKSCQQYHAVPLIELQMGRGPCVLSAGVRRAAGESHKKSPSIKGSWALNKTRAAAVFLRHICRDYGLLRRWCNPSSEYTSWSRLVWSGPPPSSPTPTLPSSKLRASSFIKSSNVCVCAR